MPDTGECHRWTPEAVSLLTVLSRETTGVAGFPSRDGGISKVIHQAASLFIFFLDLLGNRLESEGDSLLQTQACLCYICAGNVEKLVACWTRAQDGNSPLSLQVGNSVQKDVGSNTL